MGRTFEVLGGRMRKAAGAESQPALVFPTLDAEPPSTPDGPELVPLTPEDLPGDDNAVPYIEVGGPKKGGGETSPTPGPQLLPPRPPSQPAGPEVAFQLLPDDPRSRTVPPAPDLIAYQRPEHPASRQYRRLVDGIAAQHPTGRSPVLLFTPASQRTMGTATVANLAVTRASDGLGRVLVVEIDWAPGSATGRFGVPPVPGLRELLARTVPLALGLHRTGVEGVYHLPAGRTHVGVDEAARLPFLLDQLRGRFDWVLVDAPAWGTYPLMDWAQYSDSVYLLLRPDEWDSPCADAAHEGIVRCGGRLRGCVMTEEPSPPVLPAPAGSVLPDPTPAAATSPSPLTLKQTRSAGGHSGGNPMTEHELSEGNLPRRRLRPPLVIRRPGDD